MKKIVILSNSSDRGLSRMTFLKALFPECEIEIQVISPDDEDLKRHPFGSLSGQSIIEKTNWRY
jgi:hypothetical protein